MERENQQPKVIVPRSSTAWLLLVSILIHIGILALLKRPFDSIRVDSAPTKPVVNARLYFPPPPKPQPVLQPEPVNPLPEKAKEIPPKAGQVKAKTQNSQPKQQVAEDSPVAETNTTQVADDSAVQSAVMSDTTQIEKAYRHIGQRNLSKIQQMAEQAAAEFRQRKNSPVIQPATTPELSEDEKLLKGNEKKANCDGVARQTTAILTGLLGGNIKCTSKPDFQPYIQQHLDKLGANQKKD